MNEKMSVKRMLKLESKKKLPAVNDELKKNLKSIIDDLIRKDSRKEAMKIITASDKEKIGEFLYYYYSGTGNVACLVIDAAKLDLVRAKKMKQKPGDSFGKPFEI
jgi:streptomycin 6-kinase